MEPLRISNNPDEFDFDAIHRFLSEQSYWAKGVSPETVRKAFAHSLPFGGFLGTRQVAFGRAVTDMATFAYLRDITVLPEFRGRGHGKTMVEAMLARLKAEGVPAIMLGTADAHSLYGKFGFRLVGDSPNLMVWKRENAG
jgi:ribosomal protein S18 acetylase RimI-like enzyme